MRCVETRGVAIVRLQHNHWLDYDPVALVVLVLGVSTLTFLALSI
jgi:hypothetical protein